MFQKKTMKSDNIWQICVCNICSYLAPVRAAFSTVLATYQPLQALSVRMSHFGGLTYDYNRFLSLTDKAENHVGRRKAHGSYNRGIPLYSGSW